MKYKLIRLPEYDIIVNTTKYEEGIHPEVKYFDDEVDGNNIFKSSRMGTEEIIYSYVEGINENRRSVYEIIAGIGALPSIDYNGFDLELGNIEGLASEYEKENGGAFSVGIKDAFIEGARIGKSLDDKKFTKEDIMAWYKYVKTHTCEEAFEHLKKIKQQPKTFDIEVEEYQEYVRPNEHEIRNLIKHKYSTFVKITNNTIKITKIL